MISQILPTRPVRQNPAAKRTRPVETEKPDARARTERVPLVDEAVRSLSESVQLVEVMVLAQCQALHTKIDELLLQQSANSVGVGAAITNGNQQNHQQNAAASGMCTLRAESQSPNCMSSSSTAVQPGGAMMLPATGGQFYQHPQQQPQQPMLQSMQHQHALQLSLQHQPMQLLPMQQQPMQQQQMQQQQMQQLPMQQLPMQQMPMQQLPMQQHWPQSPMSQSPLPVQAGLGLQPPGFQPPLR